MTTQLKFEVDRRLFPFQSRFASLPDGVTIHYVDEGNGPTLLFLHGNPTWSFLYRKIISNLKDSFRCVALDYPGFGLSTAPEGYGYTPQEHSRIVEQFVGSLKLNDLTVMVQDWGGPIGLGFAIRQPELVQRFIIGNTWAWPVRRKHVLFSNVIGGVPGRSMAWTCNGIVRLFMRLGVAGKLSPDELGMYLAPFRERSSRAPTHIFPRQLVAARELLAEIEHNLGAVADRPALILWGEKDVAFGAKERKRFEAIFTDHRTVCLTKAAHFIQEDASEEICEAIRSWLKR